VVLAPPGISSVIFGATKLEQVDDNAAAASVDIDRSVFTKMDAILEPVIPKPPPDQFA
jgi:aryl-alcohol dehydrogenase-like predicted oxidoreductase